MPRAEMNQRSLLHSARMLMLFFPATGWLLGASERNKMAQCAALSPMNPATRFGIGPGHRFFVWNWTCSLVEETVQDMLAHFNPRDANVPYCEACGGQK